MAAPVVALTADKSSYAVGQPITLTMTYSDPDAKTITFTGTATDAEGNVGQGTVTVSIGAIDQSKNKVTGPAGYTVTKQSDSGAVAVFTTTA